VVRIALRTVRCKFRRACAAWCVVLVAALAAAAQEPPFDGPPPEMDYSDDAVEFDPSTGEMLDPAIDPGLPYVMQPEGGAFQPAGFMTPPDEPPPTYRSWMTRFGFRHSYTHGRNVGWGQPLVGSSWLNRPHYTGASLGPMWLTKRLEDSVGRDADVIGTVFYGWEWDYYWGSEFQYAYATPELVNTAADDSSQSRRLVSWNYSFMYYPWGDSELRPYWRLGVGDTKFDFPTEDGSRSDEWLFTTPFGVGLKYPFRRWLAGRIEFTDQFSWGGHGVATQHNLTLNFGLECRFGGKRKAYWPWNPSRHIW